MSTIHKILICGDRNWTDEAFILDALVDYFVDHSDTPCIVIHGDARGADKIGGRVAEALGLTIIPFPADWTKYGRAAGPIRNRLMLDQKPDIVIAFHDNIGESKGTKNMLAQARRAGVETRLLTHA